MATFPIFEDVELSPQIVPDRSTSVKNRNVLQELPLNNYNVADLAVTVRSNVSGTRSAPPSCGSTFVNVRDYLEMHNDEDAASIASSENDDENCVTTSSAAPCTRKRPVDESSEITSTQNDLGPPSYKRASTYTNLTTVAPRSHVLCISLAGMLYPMPVPSGNSNVLVTHLGDDQHYHQKFFFDVDCHFDALKLMRERERKFHPEPLSIIYQVNINATARASLLDWMGELCLEHNFNTETFHLAADYMDRFLGLVEVDITELQTVTATALHLAIKYEEIHPLIIFELLFADEGWCNRRDALKMEKRLLRALNFELSVPTSYTFLSTFVVLCETATEVKLLAQYICELSLLYIEPFLHFRRSMVAAGALVVAHCLLCYPIWSLQLEKVTSYGLQDLKEVFVALAKVHYIAPNIEYQIIQYKYRKNAFNKIANIPAAPLTEEIFDALLRLYQQANGRDAI